MLLSELTSFRVWDDLVGDAGLEPARYAEIITGAALAAVAAPVGGPGRSRPPNRTRRRVTSPRRRANPTGADHS
ncbi:MAG: hypothetical protein ACRDPA_20235 [Solirubrobacteraceae bacterium]